MSEMKTAHRFKVGDRVIYRCGDGVGYDMLDGRIGTVIGVDTTNLPYTVEFDEEFPDAMEDLFFGGKPGHCWCCANERLSPTGIKRKNKKGNPGYAGANCGMTDAEVSKIREMIEAGEPMVNIADVLGVTLTTLKNKLYVLRQRDPSFPRAHRGGKRETRPTEGGDDAPSDGDAATSHPQGRGLENGGGKLNDLEAVLADRVRELTEECESMKVYTEGNEADVDKLMLQKTELEERSAEDRMVIESLSRRLLDTDKLDEALCQARLTIAEREAEIAAQFSRIAELTAEIKRLTDMCMRLTERFVLGEGRL